MDQPDNLMTPAITPSAPKPEMIHPNSLVRRVEYEDYEALVSRIKDLEDVVMAMSSVLAGQGIVVRRENGAIQITRM